MILEKKDLERDLEKDLKKSTEFRKDFGKDIALTFLLIANNPFITIEEISKETGKTSRTIENYLKKLKDNGIIIRKGPKLGGFWEIVE